MIRTFFKGKIHRARITEANLNYMGSVTIDAELMKAADFLPYEWVQVINVTTGARLETYIIPGPPGSGIIALNGGAARQGHPGDEVILITYAQLAPEEAAVHQPKVVLVDSRNRITSVQTGEAMGLWQTADA